MYTYQPQSFLLEVYPKEVITMHSYRVQNVHCVTIYDSAKSESNLNFTNRNLTK
jgi:hypothetical protein